VHLFPLEGLEARDVWPGYLVELSSGCHKDVGGVVDCLSGGKILYFDLPVQKSAPEGKK